MKPLSVGGNIFYLDTDASVEAVKEILTFVDITCEQITRRGTRVCVTVNDTGSLTKIREKSCIRIHENEV